jgi:hypothetical protein
LAVYLSYRLLLASEVDRVGNLRAVRLTVPVGTELPDLLEAVTILDLFPLYGQTLSRLE